MSITLRALVQKAGVTPDAKAGTRVKTPEFRSTYAFVFTPKEPPGGGDLKYQLCMIFKKDDIITWKPVIQAIANAAAKKFGENPDKWPKTLKCPMRDGDEERDGDEYEGSIFMNCGTKNKPGIVDLGMNKIDSPDQFYSGCYARASLSFYSYDKSGNKGVGTGLNNIMKTKDGDRLDGVVKASSDFEEFKDENWVKPDDYDDDVPF